MENVTVGTPVVYKMSTRKTVWEVCRVHVQGSFTLADLIRSKANGEPTAKYNVPVVKLREAEDGDQW